MYTQLLLYNNYAHTLTITVWLEKHVQVQERNSRTGKFQRLTNWYGGSRHKYGDPPTAHPAVAAVGSVTWLCDWLCTVGTTYFCTNMLAIVCTQCILVVQKYICALGAYGFTE
jgi:hypothetical protein